MGPVAAVTLDGIACIGVVVTFISISVLARPVLGVLISGCITKSTPYAGNLPGGGVVALVNGVLRQVVMRVGAYIAVSGTAFMAAMRAMNTGSAVVTPQLPAANFITCLIPPVSSALISFGTCVAVKLLKAGTRSIFRFMAANLAPLGVIRTSMVGITPIEITGVPCIGALLGLALVWWAPPLTNFLSSVLEEL